MNNIILFTGGFDPIHSGHIAAIQEASTYGRVIVGLNSDSWLARKKGKYFMPYSERFAVISNLKQVMQVIDFNDDDGSACDAIEKVKKMFPNNKLIFVNGGDRGNLNTPEYDKYKNDSSIEFLFGIGGAKKQNSSSWILDKWNHENEKRKWGEFIVYYNSPNVKIKRLIIKPRESISMQYHNFRNELWFVEKGFGELYTLIDGNEILQKQINKDNNFIINEKEWHKVLNTSSEDMSIIEIQYGSKCIEEDIVKTYDIFI